MKISLNTGILALKVLSNFGSKDIFQRNMINYNTMGCLCSAQAVLNCTLIYRYQMYIIGKQDIRGLLYMGHRGGAVPRT